MGNKDARPAGRTVDGRARRKERGQEMTRSRIASLAVLYAGSAIAAGYVLAQLASK